MKYWERVCLGTLNNQILGLVQLKSGFCPLCGFDLHSTAETTEEQYVQHFVELVDLYLSSKILVISNVLRVQKTAETLIMLDCWANCAEQKG